MVNNKHLNTFAALAALPMLADGFYIDEPIFSALGAGAAFYAIEDKFGPVKPLHRLCRYFAIKAEPKSTAFFVGVGFYAFSRIGIGEL